MEIPVKNCIMGLLLTCPIIFILGKATIHPMLPLVSLCCLTLDGESAVGPLYPFLLESVSVVSLVLPLVGVICIVGAYRELLPVVAAGVLCCRGVDILRFVD